MHHSKEADAMGINCVRIIVKPRDGHFLLVPRSGEYQSSPNIGGACCHRGRCQPLLRSRLNTITGGHQTAHNCYRTYDGVWDRQNLRPRRTPTSLLR